MPSWKQRFANPVFDVPTPTMPELRRPSGKPGLNLLQEFQIHIDIYIYMYIHMFIYVYVYAYEILLEELLGCLEGFLTLAHTLRKNHRCLAPYGTQAELHPTSSQVSDSSMGVSKSQEALIQTPTSGALVSCKGHPQKGPPTEAWKF